MYETWASIAGALIYLSLLFAVAELADRHGRRYLPPERRSTVYALAIGVYCTSWTFYGSVGLAAKSGLDFLPIYIGPILLYLFGGRLIRRVIRLAKAERISSVGDFIAARYGKNQLVAATVAVIMLIGVLPYIALQLKAVATSLQMLVAHGSANLTMAPPIFGDIAFMVAFAMAIFAVLFGARYIDATEHQEGLMAAIAAESLVKLLAFLAVGVFVTFEMFEGPRDIFARAGQAGLTDQIFNLPDAPKWLVQTLISMAAVLLLPRQFYVTVVESSQPRDFQRARWLFPLYLVLINLFVIPVALAGVLTFGPQADGDFFVLGLPMAAGRPVFTFIAFIGGLSAATAMVVVASVALSVMLTNDIVMPLVLRRHPEGALTTPNMDKFLLTVRRLIIVVIVMAGYAYYRMAANGGALASYGLLSFAAVAQLGPSFLLGLLWRRANARGAIIGLGAGFLIWVYTLLVPNLAEAGLLSAGWITSGPFGMISLAPAHIFGLDADPLTHGVVVSLAFNTLLLVLVSRFSQSTGVERVQAQTFVPNAFGPAPAYRLWRTNVTVADLQATVARYLGEDKTAMSFRRYALERQVDVLPSEQADIEIVRFAEQLLASAIGAASSRLVLSLLLKRREPASRAAMQLLDDASAAIQYSHGILQTALDQVAQGIGVFDQDLRLSCWNRQFRAILDLPSEYGQIGTPFVEILRHVAVRGTFGVGNPVTMAAERLTTYATHNEPVLETLEPSGMIIEVRSSPMPDGGLVVTLTDFTGRIAAERALARSNETLERRVAERTEALSAANSALAKAKSEADEANLGKTRFLAAASHDILQPLNAARLYTTSLVEKTDATELRGFAHNVDASLEAVEEILGAVLDISRLDTGALKPEIALIRIDDILRQLKLEFEPQAKEHGLQLDMVLSSATVRSDRRLLRRLLQNLISNAIKYTPRGRVLVGCRIKDQRLLVQVYDTGVGIAATKLKIIFREFQRLDEHAALARGLGLGLSIVERISRVLDHPVHVTSRPGKGSMFEVVLPIAPPVPAAELPQPAPPVPAMDLSGLVVLAVDNEPRILEGMAALLKGWGCDVYTAPSAREALAVMKEARRAPHILLVDYHLDEGATGIEAAVQLRWRFGSELPAILITADRSPEVRAEAAEKSIDMLNKPLKPAQLRARLAQLRAQQIV